MSENCRKIYNHPLGNANRLPTVTVTVFTRHSPGCDKKANRYGKRCRCRKALYIYEDGKDTVISAKTRAWDQAERVAQKERDRRNPVKRRLQEIADQEAQRVLPKTAESITVATATKRWLGSQKSETKSTENKYKRAAWRIQEWAADQGIVNVSDITADKLDTWRSTWGKGAEKDYSSLGPTSQALFQSRLKQFFTWCLGTGNLDRNPSLLLAPISKNKHRTEPLTREQFAELFPAIELFTAAATGEVREFAKELKALFLLQRWAGLRIQDYLVLPRTGLVGNRLSLKTFKTGAPLDNRVLPDCVIETLQDLSPDRPKFLPEYFFWSTGRKQAGLATKWGKYIRDLNEYLHFTGEDGKRMRFHSHMLRDTYSVELLLAGVPLQDVSKLLTHESVAVTQRYYGRWVKARLQQLEDKSVEAMQKMGVKITM